MLPIMAAATRAATAPIAIRSRTPSDNPGGPNLATHHPGPGGLFGLFIAAYPRSWTTAGLHRTPRPRRRLREGKRGRVKRPLFLRELALDIGVHRLGE